MENLQGLIVLVLAVLFPIVWWLLNERSGSGTENRMPPEQRPPDVSDGRWDAEQYGRGHTTYGPPPMPTPIRQEPAWDEHPETTWAPPPVAMDAISLEQDEPLERDVHDEHSLETEQGERPVPVRQRSAAPTVARSSGARRRALVRLLRTPEGLSQAFLVQAVIGQPKGMTEGDADLPGRW